MKKIFLPIFIFSLITSVVFAAENSASTDEWQDIGKMQDAWDGQKIITDDLFNKIIDMKTKKSRQKEEKRFKRKVGESIAPNPVNEGNTALIKKIAEDFPTLLVPKTLMYDSTQINPGFYRILAAKTKDGDFFINFYQGNNLIGKIPATETQEDFETETINYAKIIYDEQDNTAKIVYGCIDYNLVAVTGTR